MKYIIDKEINLNEKDDLNSKSYVETLTETIRNSPLDSSFTIGLFGEWGSGKSSIVESSKQNLENDNSTKTKFIVYDAWKYANDSFRRMFLLKIQEALNFEKSDLMHSFYLNESEDVKINKKPSTTKILILVAILAIGLLIVNIIPVEHETFKISFSIFISFLGLLAATLFKIFDELKVNIQKPHLFAPEQFEDCFNEMISKSLRNYNIIQKGVAWVKGERFEKNIDKLIIVIDNIDRCNKELAYELLTDTKSFLGQIPNVVFLIPVDDSALKEHILNSKACNKEAEEFLRKFFNVTIRLKPLKTIELFDFANKLNTKNELNFKPDTIDIVAKEYASNPRRIIQFFNNLLTEIHNFKTNFDENFIADNESYICKFLIIREEWPDYYKLICSKPHLFNSEDEQKEKILKNNPDLNTFLTNTKAVTKNLSISTLEKLLSNENVFKEFPDSLTQALGNQQFDEVDKYINGNITKLRAIINYSIEELRKGIESERYTTLTIRSINSLLFINSKYPLNESENHRIQNLIEDHLDDFIPACDDFINIVKYVDLLETQQISYLTDYLVQLINSEYELSDESKKHDVFSNDILLNLLNSSKSYKVLEKIKDSISIEYIDGTATFKSMVSEDKVEHVFTDKSFKHMLEKLADLFNVNDDLNDLIYVFSLIELTSPQKEELFERFQKIYPAFTNQPKEKLLKLIENITPFFSSNYFIKQNSNTNATAFISKIFANRTVSNANKNLLQEILNSTEEVELVSKFLMIVYSSSRNNISVTSYFNTIAASSATNRKVINSIFIDLKNSFSLNPLTDIILADKTYEKDSFILLDHCFRHHMDGKPIVTEANIESKINEMAELLFSGDTRSTEITDFLENHIDIGIVKYSLEKIIMDRSKDEILLLSPKLLKLSFDKITQGEELFKYQDDIEILKAIGESGGKSHIQKLSKIIIQKLLKEESYDDSFEIIKTVNSFNSRDAQSIIGQLENIATNDKYSEIAESLIQIIKTTK